MLSLVLLLVWTQTSTGDSCSWASSLDLDQSAGNIHFLAFLLNLYSLGLHVMLQDLLLLLIQLSDKVVDVDGILALQGQHDFVEHIEFIHFPHGSLQ